MTDFLGSFRPKWEEIPIGSQRIRTKDLLNCSDQELLDLWRSSQNHDTVGDGFSVRGWYHLLYKDFFPGKKIMDVGSGFGIDSLTFAQWGAQVVFVDIVRSNLQVLERLAKLKGLSATDFVYLEDPASLGTLPNDFDVIYACGSLHNAPEAIIQKEVDELVRHLKVGGRWLQLAYPKARWVREGSLPFSQWGEKTDGAATSWMEWYDVPKLMKMLGPERFELVFYTEFHNSDFNWFDLLRKA